MAQRFADADRRWDERIRRAHLLAESHPSAVEVLEFYASLAAVQQSILRTRAHAVRPAATFVESLDRGAVADALPQLLSSLREIAPPALAAGVADMERDDAAAWRELVERRWTERLLSDGGDGGTQRAFVAEALLQPFAEAVALSREDNGVADTRGASEPKACPVCDGLPVVAALREEGHGARRSVVCGFCLTEWPAMRVVCLACGETRFDALPVYRADEVDAARVDACDTCRRYVKTIDLTRDGTAVPIVDDIATLTLDLWARAQGYERLRPNLLYL